VVDLRKTSCRCKKVGGGVPPPLISLQSRKPVSMGQARWQSAQRRAHSEKNPKSLLFLRYAPCTLRYAKFKARLSGPGFFAYTLLAK
jgi:hypothetical protein